MNTTFLPSRLGEAGEGRTAPGDPGAPPAEPTAQTYVRVARQAAELGVAAADQAMNAVCRSRSGSTVRLEDIMHAAHKEACEAERYSDWAERWEADGVPEYALARYAANGVDAAVRAQEVAGVEVTAVALRIALQRPRTAEERAERESARRRTEAREEAEERAVTGMDRDNRRQAAMNRYCAEDHVAALGWTAGHVRVLEAAVSGRLYWRDGRARQAAQPGVWEGGRKVSAERTQALYAARFLSAVRQDDGTRVLIPSPMGQVALELARLHPEGLYLSDKAAYEARYAHAKRKGMSSDEKKAAARRLPPVDAIALRLYRRPVTLAEQEPRAQLESAELWEDEGGYCPGVQTPRPAAGPRVEATQSAAAPDSAASPVADGLECPPGLLVVPLMSTRVRVWWGLECDRCVPGVRAPLPGTWDDKGDACMAARAHSEQVHRPADDTLTADELAELEHAQDGVLQRVLRLLWRGRRQAADRAPKDATPMHPDGRYFQREQRPETAPVPVGSAPAPSALIPPQAEASEDPGRRRASGGPQGQFALF